MPFVFIVNVFLPTMSTVFIHFGEYFRRLCLHLAFVLLHFAREPRVCILFSLDLS